MTNQELNDALEIAKAYAEVDSADATYFIAKAVIDLSAKLDIARAWLNAKTVPDWCAAREAFRKEVEP